jgi:ABC transporter substrate binding protein
MPDPFRQGLADVGFAEGRNVSVEYHSGSCQQLPAIAADPVLRRPAVIVAATGGAALDVKSATQTIPIVFLAGNDPVELGLVPSLNRPTTNLTGITAFSDEIASKRLEVIHKLVPGAKSNALLSGAPGNALGQSEGGQLQAASRALGLDVLVIASADKEHLAPAFATLVRQRVDAVLVGAATTLNAMRDQIIALAARHAIPTNFFYSAAISEGGLSSYGPDLKEACAPSWHLHRPYSQGREPSRPPDHPAQQVRIGDQHQDRQGARPKRLEFSNSNRNLATTASPTRLGTVMGLRMSADAEALHPPRAQSCLAWRIDLIGHELANSAGRAAKHHASNFCSLKASVKARNRRTFFNHYHRCARMNVPALLSARLPGSRYAFHKCHA